MTDTDLVQRIEQIEANSAMQIVLTERNNKLLERLLEVLGDQPDYSASKES